MPHLSLGKHSPPSPFPAPKKRPPYSSGASRAAARLIAFSIEMFKHQQRGGLSPVFAHAYVFVCVCMCSGVSHSSVFLPNLSTNDYSCMRKSGTHTCRNTELVNGGVRPWARAETKRAVTTALFPAPEPQSAMPHIYSDLCSENEEMRYCL